MSSPPGGSMGSCGLPVLAPHVVVSGGATQTDGHALSAVRLITGNLCQPMSRPSDPGHREGMAQASLDAGLALTNAIPGATDAMSHQVGGLLDAPHGVVNGVLLRSVIRCRAAAAPDPFIPVALAAGPQVQGMPGREAAEMLAHHVRALADEVGVPRALRHLGASEENIGHLAVTTVGDACLSTNPRSTDQRDVEALILAAL